MSYFGLLILLALCIFCAYCWYHEYRKVYSLEQKSLEIQNQRLHWIQESEQLENEINIKRNKLEERASELSRKEKALSSEKQLLDSRIGEIPLLAKYTSDVYLLSQNKLADQLENKSHPAFHAADVVREVNKEKASLQAQLKQWEYRCTLYESIIPDLSDLDLNEKISDISAISRESLNEHSGDRARLYLTREEYESLPSVEKYQLALDHWWDRKKTRS